MDAITVEYLEEQIADKIYVNPCGTLTICVLTMRNGLRITGESACLDVSRFDAELGKAIAYQNAFEKLWQLEGYARACSFAALGEYERAYAGASV
jgi:hypothetical protein